MNTLLMIIIILIAAGTAASALYWYAFRFEPVNFRLSEIDISVSDDKKPVVDERIRAKKTVNHPRLKETADKKDPFLTILHLSDFHLRRDKKGQKLFDFMQGLKIFRPDLILITGDLVEKNEYFSYLTDMLSGFNANLGKYAVFGVHDYYNKTIKEFTKNMIRRKKEYRRVNDVTDLIKKLDSTGIRVLRNQNVTHRLVGQSDTRTTSTGHGYRVEAETDHLIELNIIGLEDAIIEKTDIDSAFNGLIADSQNKQNEKAAGHRTGKKEYFQQNKSRMHSLNDKGRLKICITHTPDMDMLVELAKRGADLVLCGHTHGGQVRLPGIGALITGSKIKAKYASGLFYFNDFILYTSRGLGEGRYSPFRFYCQPEASLLRIYKW